MKPHTRRTPFDDVGAGSSTYPPTLKTAVSALTVLVFLALVAVAWLFQLQREHRRDFVRLQQCVAVLERNQATPAGQPVLGCPID